MKRKITLVIICLFSCGFVSAQTTVTFTLDSTDEDATIWSFDVAANYPDATVYDCFGEVFSEISEAHKRNFLKFDLTTIDSNSIVIMAKLSLYYPDTIIYPDGDYSLGNSNESVLKRVTSPWTENTVTWSIQPTTTDTDLVILPQSTSTYQDYPNIDVTAMVQQMVSNPSLNYGFLLGLTSETYWSRLLFASGDNPDSTKRPKLEVTYGPDGIEENFSNDSIKLFPNPVSENLIISSPYRTEKTEIKICNILGELVLSFNNKESIDVHTLPAGMYFIEVSRDKKIFRSKFLKN